MCTQSDTNVFIYCTQVETSFLHILFLMHHSEMDLTAERECFFKYVSWLFKKLEKLMNSSIQKHAWHKLLFYFVISLYFFFTFFLFVLKPFNLAFSLNKRSVLHTNLKKKKHMKHQHTQKIIINIIIILPVLSQNRSTLLLTLKQLTRL